MGQIRVGCCGFPKRRALYYRTFDLVEVQQTFYAPPQVSTLQRWREEAPEGFVFTLKAWQRITHPASSPTYRRDRKLTPAERAEVGFFRPTETVWRAWETTRQAAQALRAEVVVFQCPASFTPTEEHVAWMRAFFHQVSRAGLRLGWEPRGPWPDDLVRRLCRELDLLHVVDPFQRASLWGQPVYFRLHGRTGYGYRYTAEDLAALAAWCEASGQVYCLFNNRWMWEDALRFREVLAGGNSCQRGGGLL